jgi:hypothetical protein
LLPACAWRLYFVVVPMAPSCLLVSLRYTNNLAIPL